MSPNEKPKPPFIFKLFLAAIGGWHVFTPSVLAYADLAIVTHPENAVTAISPQQVKRIFLGRESFLPDGNTAIPVEQPEESAAYQEFHLKVIRMNARELRSYWAGMIFTGRGVPPINLPGDSEVKHFISQNPGAIGYIAPESLDPSVKVLLFIR